MAQKPPPSAQELVVQGVGALEGLRTEQALLRQELHELRMLIADQADTIKGAAESLAVVADTERRRADRDDAAALARVKFWSLPGVQPVMASAGTFLLLLLARLLGVGDIFAALVRGSP